MRSNQRFSRRIWIAAAAALAASGTVLSAAPADAAVTTLPCATRPVAWPFTPWGDPNAYYTLPGADFEGDLSDWTLQGGAARTAGNEPWKVVAGTAASALDLPTGASATARPMCVSSSEDSLRVFYRAPGDPGAALRITVHVTAGTYAADNTYLVQGGTAPGWTLSPRIMIPQLPIPTGQQTMTVTFDETNTPAHWQVDDVQVDPWRTL